MTDSALKDISVDSPTNDGSGSRLVTRAGSKQADPITALNALPERELATDINLLVQAYETCRSRTVALSDPLSPEDMGIQSMPDASPTKWHLAHTTWFFETFILKPNETDFAWFNEAFCELFNSYYNGVGKQHPRPRRGMISRPSLKEVLEYRSSTDGRVVKLLSSLSATNASRELPGLIRLGINHEQQHQELLITDIKHALSQNPGWPAYASGPDSREVAEQQDAAIDTQKPEWVKLSASTIELGFEGEGFCFDNETPRHRALIPDCKIARHVVSNGEWLAFIRDGGYQNPLLWLSEGWAWLSENDVHAPLYWRRNGDDWQQFTLKGAQPIGPALPVAHVSYFEADAFARWAGGRLPTEAEWECFAGLAETAPGNASRQTKSGAHRTQDPVELEFSRVWEWTASAYLPYPGFNPAPGVVGEYNGKFMVNQMVLRGASGATSVGHERLSYRNFFPTHARWQYSGLRLAKDLVSD